MQCECSLFISNLQLPLSPVFIKRILLCVIPLAIQITIFIIFIIMQLSGWCYIAAYVTRCNIKHSVIHNSHCFLPNVSVDWPVTTVRNYWDDECLALSNACSNLAMRPDCKVMLNAASLDKLHGNSVLRNIAVEDHFLMCMIKMVVIGLMLSRFKIYYIFKSKVLPMNPNCAHIWEDENYHAFKGAVAIV